MGTEGSSAAVRQAKESLELAFQMSQILYTGLERHTMSLLMAHCDRGANPEALAARARLDVPFRLPPALARVCHLYLRSDATGVLDLKWEQI